MEIHVNIEMGGFIDVAGGLGEAKAFGILTIPDR
jgi:hypothetical protein